MAHRLYYIWYETDDRDDGEHINRDLFVMAENTEEAIVLWREYYRDAELARRNLGAPDHVPTEEEIEDEFIIKADTLPNGVFTVPSEELLIRKSRAFPWKDIERVDY